MRRLILIILSAIYVIQLFAKSPHGEDFKINCVVCHTTENWLKIKKDSFNHDTTDFPLDGQHKTIKCRECHIDLEFKNAKSECISCHKDVHELTLGRDCDRCHTTATWIVNNIIQIHRQSRFPLLGAHASLDCYLCHKSASLLRFDPMRSDCVDCHLNDFNSTTNPSHVTSNFSKDCTLCHNEVSWQTSTFNHNATSFPLTGAHIMLACLACHTHGYVAIPTTCVSCHLATYNATTNPNHAAANFPTTCETCHSTTDWLTSTFNHNTATSFPLTGAHIGIACTACHTNGYGPIPTTCVSCHLATYNATTNPNHAGAMFPTTCETCHTTANWTSSTFNHTAYFPITSGNHNVSCATCHTNPTNYVVFSCVTASCHTTAHHQNQGSAGCYSCHPTGRS